MWLYFGSILAYEYFRNNIKNINQKQFNREKDILRSRLLAVVRRNSSIRLTGKKVHDSPIEPGTSPSWPTKRAHYWVCWLHTKNFSFGDFQLREHLYNRPLLSHTRILGPSPMRGLRICVRIDSDSCFILRIQED